MLTVTANMSWHTPPLDSVVPPVPRMVNVSKSSLRKQTSGKVLHFAFVLTGVVLFPASLTTVDLADRVGDTRAAGVGRREARVLDVAAVLRECGSRR